MPKKQFDKSNISDIVLGKGKEKTTPGLTPSKRATLVQKYSNGRCSYCEKKFDYLNLDVHHIKERSKGGSNRLTNLTILCAGCHRSLKHGWADKSKIKPIIKSKISTSKPKSNGRKKKARKKKTTNIFGVPDAKFPKVPF
jgi:5-methylcytosine-specific restriction endonuclease McrA